MANLHVLTTGGTIASTESADGASPTLSGEDLLAVAPSVETVADVSIERVCSVPSFAMTPEYLAETARRARAAIEDRDADGVVVTHGTDTMAETAYYLDLVLDLDRPVVLTGAQRRPEEPSSDTHANLHAAARAAVHDGLDGGAYVAFDEELHAARDVVKAHSERLTAFESPNVGPVATIARNEIRFRGDASATASLPLVEPSADVELVTSHVGASGECVHRAVEAGVDGLVLAGTGLGNVSAGVGGEVERAVEQGVPVVVATRCHAGSTAPIYGTDGGLATLSDLGVREAGTLAPWKSRLKLALALAADVPVADAF